MERKVVLITGGAMGQGKAHALKFAENGFDVVLADMQDPDGEVFRATVQEIEKLGAKALAVKCNVTSDDDMKAMFEKAWDTFGRIDVVVANAGVINFGYTWELTDAQVQKVIDIDLNGAFLTAQVAQHIMRKHNHGGSIIMTSSLSGYNANFIGGGPSPVCTYGTAKAGISQMARYMAAGLAPYGIRVNTISPGYIWSGIHEGVMDKTGHDMCLEVVPIKRFGTTDELQGVLLFLASDASSYVTGINIPVDGGYSIY